MYQRPINYKMEPHRLIKEDYNGKRYVTTYTNDLLMATCVKGDFDVDGTSPIYKGDLNLEYNGGFEIKMKGSDTFEGRYISLEHESIKNRIVICKVSYLKDLDTYLRRICGMKPKLVIIPISLDAHHRALILQPPQQEGVKGEAYYYDAFGKDLKEVRAWCINSLGYDYEYNDVRLQTDTTSCCPSVVNFAIHVVECVKNSRKISTEGMPKFGSSIFSSTAEQKEITDMLQRQKDLLCFENEQKDQVSFQTGFSEVLYNNIKVLFEQKADNIKDDDFLSCDGLILHGEVYEFPHMTHPNHTPEAIEQENRIKDKEHKKFMSTMLGIGFGGIIGIVLGYVIAQKTEISTVLTELLKVTSQQADIIFTVSACVAMGAIFGIIGNLLGEAINHSCSY